MKLVILRRSKEGPDIKFAIELPDVLGEVYRADFLRAHFIFCLDMAIADLAHPPHVPVLVELNKEFSEQKAKVVCALDNKDA